MKLEEIGAYIRILCHMADKGSLCMAHMEIIAGGKLSDNLRAKFEQNGNGLFHNKRLTHEVKRRKDYSNSRRSNRLSKKDMKKTCKTYVQHMENENENRNKDININNNRGVQGGFDDVWALYPKRIGRIHAEKHFNTTVKTDKDLADIKTALQNYLKSERVLKGYIQNGSTWFNQWRDWVDFVEPPKPHLTSAQQYSVASMARLNERLKNEKE